MQSFRIHLTGACSSQTMRNAVPHCGRRYRRRSQQLWLLVDKQLQHNRKHGNRSPGLMQMKRCLNLRKTKIRSTSCVPGRRSSLNNLLRLTLRLSRHHNLNRSRSRSRNRSHKRSRSQSPTWSWTRAMTPCCLVQRASLWRSFSMPVTRTGRVTWRSRRASDSCHWQAATIRRSWITTGTTCCVRLT